MKLKRLRPSLAQNVFYSLILLVCLSSIALGQPNKIELSKQIAKNSADTIKLRAYMILADNHLFINTDSVFLYIKEVNKLIEKRSIQSALSDDSIGRLKVKVNRYMGICYSILGGNDSALYYYNKSLDLSMWLKDTTDIIKNINNIAVALNEYGQYEKAINYYLEGLKLSEKIKNDYLIANFCNNLSVFYNSNNMYSDYNKSLGYRKKSLMYSIKLGDKNQIANCYVNLGTIFSTHNSSDSSLYYVNLAIPIYEELNDSRNLSVCYYNIASQYRRDSMYDKALENLQKAKYLAEKSADKKRLSAALSSMADLYFRIAREKTETERAESLRVASYYGHQALDIADELGSIIDIRDASSALALIYSLQGNYKNAFKYLDLNKEMSDSLNSLESAKATYKIENKYILDRNELLEREKEITEDLAHHRQIIIVVILVATFALGVTLLLLFLRMRLVKKQNEVIIAQKKVVDNQNEMLSQKNEEIITQKEEIETQRDFVYSQREEIISSINYTRRIQEAVLPKIPTLGPNTSNFVLFLPKDIVSGDFYWFSQSGNKLMLAVADCTGHGVPGACMSMLGLSYMREIAGFHFDETPARMLEIVRNMIIEALKQNGTPFEQRDGMDMSLCILDTETNELQFSAAYHSIFVIPKTGEPYSIKGNLQPIAFHYKMTPFTNHVLQMNSGDTFYLMSDGFKDQLNEHGKKFTYRRLTEMLVEMKDKPLDFQNDVLKNAIIEWRGAEKQIDDITLMGFRL